MIFSNKLIISSLIIATSQAQDDTESASQSPRLLSNQNTASLTAGALGLGIGVAGSLIVSKLIDDAAKCKPPAIGKLFPLPDLLKFNPINPECNKLYSPSGSHYRETYTVPVQQLPQYPSQGYDVVPLSSQSSYETVPVQLTPTVSYSPSQVSSHQHSGFSQTSPHTAQPDTASPFIPSHPSPASSPSVIEAYVYPDTPRPEVSYVPNPAIQPRGLSDLFSPVSPQFTETEAVVPEVDSLRTGKALEALEAVEAREETPSRPVLFQPLSSRELNNKAAAQSGFSQTQAVAAVTDSFRNGKSVNSDVEILLQPREIGTSSQRLVENSGFSETEVVVPEPDLVKSVKQVKSGRVLFKPVAEDIKLSRQGKSLPAVRKTEPTLFTSSLSSDQHPVSALPDLSQSETSHGPKTFSSGV